MNQYLAVYTGTPSSFERWISMAGKDREKLEAKGIKAWEDWSAAHADAIVVEGGPLGKTRHVGPAGISTIRNNLSGYCIVEAESHETAARMFENHPHFTIFPGDAVEIMECLSLPGM